MRPLFFKVLPQYSACSIYERNKQVAGVFFCQREKCNHFFGDKDKDEGSG